MQSDKIKKPSRKGKIDWEALKIEYLNNPQLSLNALRERHCLSSLWFYHKTKGWDNDRQAIRERALARAEKQIEKTYEGEYKNYLQAISMVQAQWFAILKKTTQYNKDGKLVVVSPLDASQLSAFTSSLERALKCERLIKGQSTEEISVKSMQAQMLKVISEHSTYEEKIASKGAIIDTTAIPQQ